MPEAAQNLFMALGAALILVGVLVLVFRPVAGENSMKLFGQEVRISAPGLVVIALGCGMFTAPFVIPIRPGAAPTARPEIKVADIAPKPDVVLNQPAAPKPEATLPQETVSVPRRAPKQEVAPKQDATPKPVPVQHEVVVVPRKPPHQQPVSNPPASTAETTPAVAQPVPEQTAPAAKEPPKSEVQDTAAAQADDGGAPSSAAKAMTPILSALLTSLMKPHPKQPASTAPRCKDGFVWREARPADHVCVPPAARARTARENAQAANRVDPSGAYGPSTCVSGYVWREAYAGDVVCVAPSVRSAVREENQLGAERMEQ